MRKLAICFYPALCLFLLFSCSEEKKKSRLTLDDCPIIATQTDDLTTLDLSLVRDTFDFPLSALLSGYELIRLENSEEALVGATTAYAISENYIGIRSSSPSDYKLFNRKGEYIRSISSVGQGPDEYLIGIYDSYIDEKNNKVYLLSFGATKLLVFDLEGNPLKHIRLPFRVPKGRFMVDEEKQELLMTALPFPDTPLAVWIQDFQGNIIRGIDSKPFIINPPDYSNEVNVAFNTGEIDYTLFYWVPTQDSLYHYNKQDNRLFPAFTAKWANDEIIRHGYTELPNHYITLLVRQSATISSTPRHPRIIVDKNTLRGCYINLKYNMLGNIDGPTWCDFTRGYFIASFYPYELKEQLGNALSRPERLTPEMKDKLQKLNKSITEDDNNILLIGKLKNG
ncbi:MAG: 6-bladed beta-propeller [Tannerellaceae bacterium]|nr:6-bladed beta-propeller [Tannerellaceae bacterium]